MLSGVNLWHQIDRRKLPVDVISRKMCKLYYQKVGIHQGQREMDYGDYSTRNTDNGNPEGRLKSANYFYLIWFCIFGIICFILFNTGHSWFVKIINTKATGNHAIGLQCVARTTCPLAIWFLLHSLLTLCNNDLKDSFQVKFHSSFYLIHAIVSLAIWGAFVRVPDSFFNKFYLPMCMYASGVYLVIQILILIFVFDSWNRKYREGNLKLLVFVTALLFLVSLVAFGVSYHIFTKSGCSSNYIFISVHMVICIGLFILAGVLNHGSIFTASLVSMYCAYLTIAGMMSETKCNRIATSNQGIGFSVLASIFTLLWAGYSAYSSTFQFKDCFTCEQNEGEEQIFSLSFFHGLFALASIYVTMIVSHWGQVEVDDPWATDRGSVPRWVNFAATWFVMLVYAFSLLGRFTPCLRDREWSN
jgi:hypothetical protein